MAHNRPITWPEPSPLLSEVTSNQVLELVNASSCSAYDCEFVALARDLKVSLVTVDRQILTDFPDTAISLDAFVRVK